jgi:hypothetical protein
MHELIEMKWLQQQIGVVCCRMDWCSAVHLFFLETGQPVGLTRISRAGTLIHATNRPRAGSERPRWQGPNSPPSFVPTHGYHRA